MRVEPATEEDIEALIDIFKSRPGSNWATYTVDPEYAYVVARDRRGVAAWLAVKDIKEKALYIGQFECEWRDGKPTMRGGRGVWALVEWVKRQQAELKRRIVAMVALDNPRHEAFLKGLNMKHTVNVYESPE